MSEPDKLYPRNMIPTEDVPIPGDEAGSVTHYQIVVLRDDQVQRIAEAVVKLMRSWRDV